MAIFLAMFISSLLRFLLLVGFFIPIGPNAFAKTFHIISLLPYFTGLIIKFPGAVEQIILIKTFRPQSPIWIIIFPIIVAQLLHQCPFHVQLPVFTVPFPITILLIIAVGAFAFHGAIIKIIDAFAVQFSIRISKKM